MVKGSDQKYDRLECDTKLSDRNKIKKLKIKRKRRSLQSHPIRIRKDKYKLINMTQWQILIKLEIRKGNKIKWKKG